MTLDLIDLATSARVIAVNWDVMAPNEARRMRALGIDEGAVLRIAHRGIFAGRDPLAVEIGRMMIALRRAHARAITVEPLLESMPGELAGATGR